MKKISKKLISFVMAVVLTLSLGAVAFAAEIPDSYEVSTVSEDGGVSTASNSYESSGIAVSTSWTTIATSTTGFGCNIKVSSIGTTTTYVSIRMLDKSGNVLWSETKSFGSLSSRVYYCGSDVYKLQAKYVSGSGTIICYPTTEATN